MTAPIDIGPDQLRMVEDILSLHGPRPIRVWVSGSRARRTARRFSDLDLAMDAGRKLSLKELARLQCGFEDSSLPWRVDLIDLNAVSGGFRKAIEDQAVPLAAARRP